MTQLGNNPAGPYKYSAILESINHFLSFIGKYKKDNHKRILHFYQPCEL